MDDTIPILKTELVRAIHQVKETVKEDPDVLQARQVASLNTHPGWHQVKKLMEAEIEQLRELTNEVDFNDTPESAGFKFIASRLCIGKLKVVIDYVEQLGRHTD